MTSLNLIIENMFSIYFIAFVIATLTIFLFRNKRLSISIVLINWQSVVGIAVIIYLLLYSKTLYNFELTLLVLTIESVLLLVVTYLLRHLAIKIKRNIQECSANNILCFLLMAGNGIMLFLFLSNPSSMGIFSEGSRIEYLSNGALPLLLTYMSMVINSALMISISSRIYCSKFSKLDVFAIFLMIINSLVSGSKGGVFLSILNMLVLAWGLGHTFENISRSLKLVSLFFALSLVGVYTFVLSQFLSTTFTQNINIAIARFVLSADGRALASDYQIRDALMANVHGDLLSEIFKSFAPQMGSVVSDIPLGNALYASAYDYITTLVGSNPGFSTLIMSYYDNAYDLLSIALCLVFTAVVIAAGYLTMYLSETPLQQVISVAFIFSLLLTIMQDYHAFELMADLLFVWMCMILFRRLSIAAIRNMSSVACKQ
jgi:hypothetical protein